jgi:hypothetical protein
MNVNFENFAYKFIIPSYRKRFLYEVEKKPGRLMKKIRHNIENVFYPNFRNPKRNIDPNVQGYLYDILGRMEKLNWSDAKKRIEEMGGGGWLFISSCGNFFYAESEGEPPKEFYGV